MLAREAVDPLHARMLFPHDLADVRRVADGAAEESESELAEVPEEELGSEAGSVVGADPVDDEVELDPPAQAAVEEDSVVHGPGDVGDQDPDRFARRHQVEDPGHVAFGRGMALLAEYRVAERFERHDGGPEFGSHDFRARRIHFQQQDVLGLGEVGVAGNEPLGDELLEGGMDQEEVSHRVILTSEAQRPEGVGVARVVSARCDRVKRPSARALTRPSTPMAVVEAIAAPMSPHFGIKNALPAREKPTAMKVDTTSIRSCFCAYRP
ncbi:hypothetical protein D3C87_1404950 [compost metagenome]